jgi:hypothetical protein
LIGFASAQSPKYAFWFLASTTTSPSCDLPETSIVMRLAAFPRHHPLS